MVTIIFACHYNSSTSLTELTFSSVMEPRKLQYFSSLTSDFCLQTLAYYPIFEHCVRILIAGQSFYFGRKFFHIVCISFQFYFYFDLDIFYLNFYLLILCVHQY